MRVVYDQAGRGVEHLHALYRPDRYAFEIDLVRSGAAKTKAWSPVVRAQRQSPAARFHRKPIEPQSQTGASRAATLNQEGE